MAQPWKDPTVAQGAGRAGYCLKWHRSIAAMAILFTGVFGSMAAHPCSLEGGLSPESFRPLHPQSLRVAHAINRAVTEAVVDGPPAKPSPFAFYKVSSYLDGLRKLLVANGRDTAGKSEFYVLLVEYGLWTRFSPHANGMEMTVHVAKPDDSATVIVTGDTVIRAIVDRAISLRQAQDRDLVVFSGPEEGMLSTRLLAATER